MPLALSGKICAFKIIYLRSSMSFLPYVSVLFGLALLVWSSDKFVEAAAATANILRISPLVVGIIIMGFGTSAPELLVSLQAAIDENPGLAVGNAFGSNIANMTLILGSAVLFQSLQINRVALKRDLPILIGITILVAIFMFDLYLSRFEAILFLALLVTIMFWQTLIAKREQQMPEDAQQLNKLKKINSKLFLKNLALLVFTLVILVLSAKLLVWGSIEIAHSFGISDLVIGLTLVAVGTSLPELAASVAAALKGEGDLAIGNVIGSNLFNTLGVLGVAASVAPFALAPQVLTRDLPLTLAISILMLILGLQKFGKIKKWQGVSLLVIFITFQISLFLS